MRKFRKLAIVLAVVTTLLIASATPVLAVKPANNLAGAQKVGWNLSAAVMPVPPYGTPDIPGSDTASKLIVNQPNGNIEVAITGAMNGLAANTTYTVYISNGYEPYVDTGWNIVGDWVISLDFGGPDYDHDLSIQVQSDGTFKGTGGYPTGGDPYSYPYNETITGTIDVVSGAVTIHSVYENGYYFDAWGTIAPDGTMSGSWQGSGQPVYTWESTSGAAVKTHTGDTGWPGLFPGQQDFTFTTDESGAGSWHVNLKNADFDSPGTYTLSVWINSGGTLLISDNFDVVVD